MAVDGTEGTVAAAGGPIDSSGESSSTPPSQQRPVMSVRVLAETNEGNRPHMEDVTCCLFDKSRPGGQAFLAIFDGHGGRQAAAYAKDHLWENMKLQEGFNSDDHEKVEQAMCLAFAVTQRGMEKVVGTWPRARYGLPSTSGTTASVAILRGRVLYTAHLGDSGIVLGRRRAAPVVDDDDDDDDDGAPSDSSGGGASGANDAEDDSDGEDDIVAVPLTVDHKPDSEAERSAIERRGGKVRSGTRGVSRVVWRRKRPVHGRTVLNMAHSELVVEEIPFLGVARSLGDLWSYNPDVGEYIVSCHPDVAHRTLTVDDDQFIVLASDGLWNVMTPRQAVASVALHTRQSRGSPRDADADDDGSPRGGEDDGREPSPPAQLDDVCHTLVQEALKSWRDRRQRADNISVIVAYFNQPTSTSPASSATPPPLQQDGGSSRTATPLIATEAQLPAQDEPPTRSPATSVAAAAARHGAVSSSGESSSSSSEDAVVPGAMSSSTAARPWAPVLRRFARVHVEPLGLPVTVDTPSSDDSAQPAAASTAVTPPPNRTTRASSRRSSTSAPSPGEVTGGGTAAAAVAAATATAGSGARPAKRRSTPSSAEGQAKRSSSRSSLRSHDAQPATAAATPTPLQEDTVSSSGDDV